MLKKTASTTLFAGVVAIMMIGATTFSNANAEERFEEFRQLDEEFREKFHDLEEEYRQKFMQLEREFEQKRMDMMDRSLHRLSDNI